MQKYLILNFQTDSQLQKDSRDPHSHIGNSEKKWIKNELPTLDLNLNAAFSYLQDLKVDPINIPYFKLDSSSICSILSKTILQFLSQLSYKLTKEKVDIKFYPEFETKERNSVTLLKFSAFIVCPSIESSFIIKSSNLNNH